VSFLDKNCTDTNFAFTPRLYPDVFRWQFNYDRESLGENNWCQFFLHAKYELTPIIPAAIYQPDDFQELAAILGQY